MKGLQQILLLALKIIVDNAAGLLGKQAGHIRTHNKVLGKPLHPGHQNGRLLPLTAAPKAHQKGQNQA